MGPIISVISRDGSSRYTPCLGLVEIDIELTARERPARAAAQWPLCGRAECVASSRPASRDFLLPRS